MLFVRRLLAASLYLSFVAFTPGMNAVRAAEYQPLVTGQGPSIAAQFQYADSSGNWKFSTKEGRDGARTPLSVSAADVVTWGAFRDFQPGHRLRLASGGEIVGYQIEIDRDRVILESDLIGAVDLPLAAAAAILFDPPRTSSRAQDPKEIAAQPNAKQDLVLLTNGDTLAGRLVSLHSGKVVIRAGDEEIIVDRSRMAAIVFDPSLLKVRDATSVCTWVGLADGSRALATSIETDGKQLHLRLHPAATVTVPIDSFVALQPLGGRVVYLSDTTPAGYRHVPFLELPWKYQFDRNVLSGPLISGGRLYLKGIGMHSAARITFDLDGKYERFAADLAIDDVTRGRGSVVCRVFLDDGAGDWHLKYESPVIRGGQQPEPMEIDVSSAKRISLLIDFADRGDEQDHLNWLNARFIKKP